MQQATVNVNRDHLLVILRHLKGLVRELEKIIEETDRASTER